MPPPPETLDALMARLAAGDRRAFPGVFEGLRAPVRGLCRAMLRDEAAAEDAAQEAMQKIFSRAADYDSTRPAMPWALAIAAWECRTSARKQARRREAPAHLTPEREGEALEDELLRREQVEALLASMGELHERDRETLRASFWGEETDASGATLRKRRERALTRLRETFRRIYGLD